MLGRCAEIVPDGIVVVECDGTMLIANGLAHNLFGYGEGSLVGRNLKVIVPSALSDDTAYNLETLFEAGDVKIIGSDLSLEAVRLDGTRFPVEIAMNPIGNEAGGMLAVCSIRDLTERQRELVELEEFRTALEELIRQRTELLEEATNKLQRQTEALDQVLESMGEGVIVIDQESRFEFFNPAAEEMLGVGPTEERPNRWPEIYGTYAADEWTLLSPDQLPLIRALRGEKVDNAMVFIRNAAVPEGRHVSVTARPLPSQDDKPSGALAVFRDVTSQKRSEEGLRKSSEELERRVVERTLSLARANRDLNQKIEERRRTEEALRSSERQLRLMADSLPLLVAYVDVKHRYLFMNAAYQTWFGINTGEIVGRPVWEVVGVERYKEIRPFMESALEGTHVFSEIDVDHQAAGKRRVQMNLVPDIDEDGSVQGFYAVGIDMTDRQRQENP